MDCRLALVYSDEDRGRAGDVKALRAAAVISITHGVPVFCFAE